MSASVTSSLSSSLPLSPHRILIPFLDVVLVCCCLLIIFTLYIMYCKKHNYMFMCRAWLSRFDSVYIGLGHPSPGSFHFYCFTPQFCESSFVLFASLSKEMKGWCWWGLESLQEMVLWAGEGAGGGLVVGDGQSPGDPWGVGGCVHLFTCVYVCEGSRLSKRSLGAVLGSVHRAAGRSQGSHQWRTRWWVLGDHSGVCSEGLTSRGTEEGVFREGCAWDQICRLETGEEGPECEAGGWGPGDMLMYVVEGGLVWTWGVWGPGGLVWPQERLYQDRMWFRVLRAAESPAWGWGLLLHQMFWEEAWLPLRGMFPWRWPEPPQAQKLLVFPLHTPAPCPRKWAD